MLAIVGYGDHVRKNIIPALSRMGVESVSVYSPSIELDDEVYFENIKIHFNSKLENILQDNLISHVYIATPISTHYEIAIQCIASGKNVLCEKVITDKINKVTKLFNLAKDNNVYLDEVCIFKFHCQYDEIKDILTNNKCDIHEIDVSFSIPHLEKNNIRYSKDNSGGALLDVGYYPLCFVSELFFEAELKYSKIFRRKGFEVDTTGVAVFEMGDIIIKARWGIGCIYENELVIKGEEFKYIFERPFTKPFDYSSTYDFYTISNEVYRKTIKSDDYFLNIFNDFFENFEYSERTEIAVLKRIKILLDLYEN